MNEEKENLLSQYRRDSEQFRAMPPRMQDWILESPNATRDYAEFFQRGGQIEPKTDIQLPFYKEEQPPQIYVNESQWHSLTQNQAASEWPQRHMFGTLAHEIGHDRFNTGAVPFAGKTAEEYVQYRSGLEAQAIFTAFPIFKDLEHLPEFKTSKPFGSIGYLNEVELGALYGDWKAGKLDDAAVIKQMTAKVADAPYTLANPPQDMNHDGRMTHRDAYLRDFDRYINPKLEPQTLIDAPMHPTNPKHQDNAMLEQIRTGVRSIDEGVEKPYDDKSERVSRSLLAACKDNREMYLDNQDYSLAGPRWAGSIMW